MKKHLLVAAVAAAVAAPVMAQNVSVYGAIDMSVGKFEGTNKISTINNDTLRTSRLGVRGSDDLGGGLKGEFMLQGNFQPQGAAATGYGSATGNQSLTSGFNFAEEAWVGVSGAFGHVRIGTTDVTGLQALDTTVAGGINAFNSTTNANEIGNNLGDTVRYISPNINGLVVDLAYHFGANKGSTTKDAQNSMVAGLVSYTAGPLALYYGMANAKDRAGQATAGKRSYDAFGATYDAGFAKFGAIYSRADDDTTAGNDKDFKQLILNAAVPLGNGLTLAAGFLSFDAPSNAGAEGYSVALVKQLSKRTDVYAVYSAVNNDTGGSNRWSYTGGIASANVAANSSPTALGLGISHSF